MATQVATQPTKGTRRTPYGRQDRATVIPEEEAQMPVADNQQAQINDLKQMITSLFQEVKQTLVDIEKRLRNIESTTVAELAVLRQRMDEAETDINCLGVKIDTLEKAYINIETTNKILKWMLSLATVIIGALAIALFTKLLGLK